MSHDIVNDLTTLMGLTVLRKVLQKIKNCDPSWYAIIGDKITDVPSQSSLW